MNEFKIKNGLVVEQGPSQITGSLDISGPTTISGSLNVTQGITGSLFGTASHALDIPKDATIISGSTNAVQGGAVFDALALNTSFLNEDLIIDKFLENQLTYMIVPLGNSGYTTLRIGNLVQVNNQGLSSFPTGVQYVTTAVAGTIGFFRGTVITLGSTNFVTKSKFKMVTIANDTRFFHGFSTMYRTAAPTNIEPDTMINSMGVCKLSTSDNFHFMHNDGGGLATTIDLGVNFPATTIDGYSYTLEFICRVGFTDVTMILTRNDGLTTSTIISTNIPTGGQSHCMWITNNTTATLLRVYHYGSVYNTLT